MYEVKQLIDGGCWGKVSDVNGSSSSVSLSTDSCRQDSWGVRASSGGRNRELGKSRLSEVLLITASVMQNEATHKQRCLLG